MLVFRAEIHTVLVRIPNREDPDQTASSTDLGLPCLSRPFWQATSVQIFRTYTKYKSNINYITTLDSFVVVFDILALWPKALTDAKICHQRRWQILF